MSICLVTAYDKAWQELGALTSAGKRDYALRHGYQFIEYVGDPGKYHPAWMKLDAIRIGLEVSETVFWSDADAIIVNPERVLGDRLKVGAAVTISEDQYGLNSGAFFVTKSSGGYEFLSMLYAWKKGGDRSDQNDSPWEQRPINLFYSDGTFNDAGVTIHIANQKLFNAYDPQYYPYGKYSDGDFMLHYAGRELSWKLDRCKEQLSRIAPAKRRCLRNCKLERKA